MAADRLSFALGNVTQAFCDLFHGRKVDVDFEPSRRMFSTNHSVAGCEAPLANTDVAVWTTSTPSSTARQAV